MPRRAAGVSRRSWLGTVAAHVLAAPAGALHLAACAGGTDTAPHPTPQPRVTPVQLYFSGGSAEQQLFTALKQAFERRSPQFRLDLLFVHSEIETLLGLLAAGTPPDVFWNRVRTSQALMRRKGALVDLLPLMQRDKVAQDDFWPSAVRAYTYEGGYFGLPTSAAGNAVYFNKVAFREAGIPTPDLLQKQGKWSWDTLVDTARKLTRAGTGGMRRYGFMRPAGLALTVQYMWQNGGMPFSDDRTESLLTTPEVVDAMEWVTDLVLKHRVTPPVGAPGEPDFSTNALVGMQQADRSLLPTARRAISSGAIDPGMVVAPKGPREATVCGDDLAASMLTGAKAPAAAWAFAKWWSSVEGQLLVLRSGLSYTARRSLARNSSFLEQALQPWEDTDTYYRGLSRTAVFPVTPRFPEVVRLFDEQERLAHAGEKPVRQAMAAAHQAIAPLLKEPF